MSAAVASSSGSSRPPLDRHALELDENGQFTSFGHYMHAKVNKLIRQVHNGAEQTSHIFDGLSFYVNGYTNPPALELRQLIVANGGEYHHYYFHGTTTYTVACNLSVSKWNSLRADEKVIRPEWIIECIKIGHLLPVDTFLLRRPNPTVSSVAAPAGAPKVSDFYQRSRLHLISTLAQELKAFVAELRRSGSGEFPSRQRLAHLAQPENWNHNGSDKLKAIICHIDMDCFFVSVALRDRPDLRGKPVAITHSKSGGSAGKGGYGEIASCSYEARACGVRSSMLVNRAVELCPALVCLPYQFDDYRETSKLLYKTIASYTLDIRAVSCDEMYINLTEFCTQMRIRDAAAVVAELRRDVFQATQCNASAGIGSNVLLARLATKKAKPNGQFWVRDADVADFMASFSLRDLPGVGYAMEYRLHETFDEERLRNCRQMQAIPLAKLQAVCGEKMGLKIFDSCRGICKDELDVDTLDAASTRKSVSCDVNFGIRMSTKEELWKFFDDVGGQLATKLETLEISGSALTLKLMIRAPDAPLVPKKYGAHGPCNTISKTFVYAEPTRSGCVIASGAKRLAAQLGPVITDIRGIGLQMTRLTCSNEIRGSLKSNKNQVERDAAQPSIMSFLKVRKTPSPIVFDEIATDKNESANLPMKSKILKQPAKSTWSMFAVPKTRSSKAKCRRPTVPQVKQQENRPSQANNAVKESKDLRALSMTSLRIMGNSLYISDILIDFSREPSDETTQRLENLLIRLVENLHFRKTKCFYSFLHRNAISLSGAHAKWLLFTKSLHEKLNTSSMMLYGMNVLD